MGRRNKTRIGDGPYDISIVGDAICFPTGANDFVSLDAGNPADPCFRAEIRMSPDGSDSLLVKVVGKYRGGTIARAIQMTFDSVVRASLSGSMMPWRIGRLFWNQAPNMQ